VAEALALLDACSGTSRVTADSDETALHLAAAEMQQPRSFAWLPLRDIAAAHGCHAAHSAALAALRSRLGELRAKLPPTPLLTLVGCGRANPGLGCVAVTVSAGCPGASTCELTGEHTCEHTGSGVNTGPGASASAPLPGGVVETPPLGGPACISGREAAGLGREAASAFDGGFGMGPAA
jgi:hypothetical protein